jgi:hypothetical protein
MSTQKSGDVSTPYTTRKNVVQRLQYIVHVSVLPQFQRLKQTADFHEA